ncbi:MAG: cytochrome c biogenesis protein ResB, partial [Fimbriiglobus sp.]
NLLAAHLVRMKLSWKRAGVITLHTGILLLFVGEFITREYQIEQQMTIAEGESSDFAFDHRHAELALIDTSDPKEDKVTVVSDRLLKRFADTDQAFDNADLPVSVQVIKWMKNSTLVDAAKAAEPNYATAGIGLRAVAEERPEVNGVTQEQKVDLPSAYVALYKKGTQEKLGTYLVSCLTERPQTVDVDGKTYEVALRFVHYYKPFRIHLKDFTFDRYPGTTVPKNYASDVELDDPETGQRRPVTIRMNEPLRYRGETFYQSSFTPDEKGTVLQVVRNPGWVLPYVACILVTLGMLLHFGLNLGTFLSRTRAPKLNVARDTGGGWVIPVISVGLAGLYVYAMATANPQPKAAKFDFTAAGRLLVLEGGRVKPLDTVARKDIRLITHREDVTDAAGTKRSAVQWYIDVASTPVPRPNADPDLGPAGKMPIFRIENDQLWDLLGVKRREGLRYSIDEMKLKIPALGALATKAEDKPEKDRTAIDAAAMELAKHIQIYLGVVQGHGRTASAILPPVDGQDWRKPGDVRVDPMEKARDVVIEFLQAHGMPGDIKKLDVEQKKQVVEVFEAAVERFRNEPPTDPGLAKWEAILAAYRAGDAERFNKEVAEFAALSEKTVPTSDLNRSRFEAWLNGFAPFFQCLVLYGIALLITKFGWVAAAFSPAVGRGSRRAAFWVLMVTFVVHTFGLFSRMYLMERPMVFVTNLYSSAVFIGWAAVGICLLVEVLFPLGIGNGVAASLGIVTNIIAHNLALGGDTLEMMQAVLDTNFWLATHVTTVTLGYSATYVAAVVAMAYVGLGVFSPLLDTPAGVGPAAAKPATLGKVIAQVVYGIVCLATLFSFVGTVLGGIWADQSWGRFWGWDPKENGAVLIVAWNALILHARWCGLVKDRGVAVLAIAGAIITTWSWFGTNQLGVGLHAYGFSKQLVNVCLYTWGVSAAAIGLGLVPAKFWQSDVR